MRIPMNDLRRQAVDFGPELDQAVRRVVHSGWYVLGPEVEAFEAEFASYCGVQHCISVGNGTDALEIALRAVGCGVGDEVITVANAGMYAAGAIVQVGATPVFAEISEIDLLLDINKLEAVLSNRTKAIIFTHLYGRMGDVRPLVDLGQRLNIRIIEDCAQSHGASVQGCRSGSIGDLGCFSFYPTKNLGALGDGGAVTTRDADLAMALKKLRQYGWKKKYIADAPHGRNSRLDEMQAAILRVKLPHLDRNNEIRRAIIKRYSSAASGSLDIFARSGPEFVGHLCIIRSANRGRVAEELGARGIMTDVHYPIADHHQAALTEIVQRTDLTISENACASVLTLPCFPEMTEEEISYVEFVLLELAQSGNPCGVSQA